MEAEHNDIQEEAPCWEARQTVPKQLVHTFFSSERTLRDTLGSHSASQENRKYSSGSSPLILTICFSKMCHCLHKQKRCNWLLICFVSCSYLQQFIHGSYYVMLCHSADGRPDIRMSRPVGRNSRASLALLGLTVSPSGGSW